MPIAGASIACYFKSCVTWIQINGNDVRETALELCEQFEIPVKCREINDRVQILNYELRVRSYELWVMNDG